MFGDFNSNNFGYRFIFGVLVFFLGGLAYGRREEPFYRRICHLYAAIYLTMLIAIAPGFGLYANPQVIELLLGATLAGTLSFFVLTNLAVWAFSGMYPRTPEGLVACYVAALPFLQNSLAGDLTFALALFGGFHLAQQHFAWLRDPVPAAA